MIYEIIQNVKWETDKSIDRIIKYLAFVAHYTISKVDIVLKTLQLKLFIRTTIIP